LTENTHAIVQHLDGPNDLILNTAQMRDAVHVQRHRVPSTELDTLSVVQESSARTIDARRMAAGTSNLLNSAVRGRGRGRGRAVAGRLTVSGRGRGRGRGRGESEPLSALRE